MGFRLAREEGENRRALKKLKKTGCVRGMESEELVWMWLKST